MQPKTQVNGEATITRDIESRLGLFDQATERQQARDDKRIVRPSKQRGWNRESIYASRSADSLGARKSRDRKGA